MSNDQLAEKIVSDTFDDANKQDVDSNCLEATDQVQASPTRAPRPQKKESSARSLDPTQCYLRELGFTSLLTPEEELHYARLTVKGDEKAKNRMIESNLRLVVKMARRYINRGMDYLDIIEEGNLGLIHALEKFDPERGFRFSTYATWWIKQTIERAIMNQTRTIRLPVHVIKELNIYLRAGKELQKKLGHDPSPEEIAQALDKPVEAVRHMLNLRENSVSLDSTISGDTETTLVDIVPDDAANNPEHLLENESLVNKLSEWLEQLNEKHREVLMRRFGLGGYPQKETFETIGVDLGISRERIRQLQTEALRELRKIIANQGVNIEDLL